MEDNTGSISKNEINELKKTSNQLRKLVLEMTANAGSGHPGGSLSSADLITAIYFNILNHKPEDPDWSKRDIFILSKGHCSPILYSALAVSGYFEEKELNELRKLGAVLQGHPDSKKTPGVEVCTGSLGQGLSIGCGVASSIKLEKTNRKVYVLLGDGECNEGQIWEAALFASHFKLDNLIALVDANGYQVDGTTDQIMNLEPLDKKFDSFGWEVHSIDGHNIEQIVSTLKKATSNLNKKPKVIIAKTIKGKGVSFMENENKYHGTALTKEELQKALEELRIGSLEN